MSRVYPDVCPKVRTANFSAVSTLQCGREPVGDREEELLYAHSLQQTNCKYDLVLVRSNPQHLIYIHTHIHTYIHTYTHTYIYTHMLM